MDSTECLFAEFITSTFDRDGPGIPTLAAVFFFSSLSLSASFFSPLLHRASFFFPPLLHRVITLQVSL